MLQDMKILQFKGDDHEEEPKQARTQKQQAPAAEAAQDAAPASSS